jgi:hypothetical protein
MSSDFRAFLTRLRLNTALNSVFRAYKVFVELRSSGRDGQI